METKLWGSLVILFHLRRSGVFKYFQHMPQIWVPSHHASQTVKGHRNELQKKLDTMIMWNWNFHYLYWCLLKNDGYYIWYLVLNMCLIPTIKQFDSPTGGTSLNLKNLGAWKKIAFWTQLTIDCDIMLQCNEHWCQWGCCLKSQGKHMFKI